MKLTLEEFQAITTGAVALEQEEKGVRFFRFNQEQRELRQPRVTYPAEKMYSTAGIQFFFRTNSRSLYLRTTVEKGSASDHFSFDLFVNGQHTDSLENLSTRELGTYEKTFRLGEGEKDICLYFPWSVGVVIEELSLEEGASLTPTLPEKKLLVYGDSVTHGNTVRYSCNHYIPRLSRAMGVQVRNKAIAGSSSFPEMVQAESPYDPDYVLVAYGSNDWDRYEEAFFAENYRLMMQLIAEKYPRAQVLVITPIWRGNTASAIGSFEACRNAIAEAAEARGMIHIDGLDMVPPIPELFADGWLHPNALGFGFYGENFTREILKHLK